MTNIIKCTVAFVSGAIVGGIVGSVITDKVNKAFIEAFNDAASLINEVASSIETEE